MLDLDEFEFRQNSTVDVELAAFERLKKKTTYNIVSTLVPSFLIGSSSVLQIRRTAIKSRKSLNFGTVRPLTAEVAALERLKIFP